MKKIKEGNFSSTRSWHPHTQRVAVIAVSVESQHIKSFVCIYLRNSMNEKSPTTHGCIFISLYSQYIILCNTDYELFYIYRTEPVKNVSYVLFHKANLIDDTELLDYTCP